MIFLCSVCCAQIHFRQYLCAACYAGLPWHNAYFVSLLGVNATGFPVCAPFLYHKPVRNWLHAIKYRGHLQWRWFLAQALVETALSSTGFSLPDVIIPIPLHEKRLRARGFNQSYILAARLGVILGRPVWPNGLLRKVDTRSQVSHTRKQRLVNVHNAFLASCNVAQKHVLLVDDIVTTGATLCAAKEVLMARGALSVKAWVAAVVMK